MLYPKLDSDSSYFDLLFPVIYKKGWKTQQIRVVSKLLIFSV